MDNYTIRGLREEAAAAGRPPKPLVSLRPQDSLHAVIAKLFRSRCSMAPVLSAGEGAPLSHRQAVPQPLLHGTRAVRGRGCAMSEPA